MSRAKLAVGTRVQSVIDERLTGKIAGYTEVDDTPLYIVELDKGFWADGDLAVFTKLLVCHPDSVVTKEQWNTLQARKF